MTRPLVDPTETSSTLLNLIRHFGRVLESGQSPEDAAADALAMIVHETRTNSGQLWLHSADPADPHYKLTAELWMDTSSSTAGLPPETLLLFDELCAGNDLHLITDLAQNERFEPLHRLFPEAHCVAVLPLRSGAPIGLVLLFATEPRRLAAIDSELLTTLAVPVALSLQNARLFAREHLRRQQAEALSAAMEGLASSVDSAELLDNLLEHLRKVVPFDSAAVFLEEGHWLRIAAAAGFADPGAIIGHRYPSDSDLFPEMKRTQAPLFIPDVHQDPRFRYWEGTYAISSWLGVPIILNESAIGYITIDRHERNSFGTDEITLAHAFASQAAVAIQKATLFTNVQHRAQELDALAELSAALRLEADISTILNTVLDHACRLLSADVGVIAAPNGDGDALRIVAARGFDANVRRYGFGKNNVLLRHVFRNGALYVTQNLFEDPLADVDEEATDELEEIPVITAAVSPLRAGTRSVGVLGIMWFDLTKSAAVGMGILSALSELAGSALHRAYTLEMLEQRVEERTHALEIAYQQLKELDRLKNEFIASLNHDLRTPLTNIKLYSNLLATGKPENRQRYLDVLRRETDKLHQLIDTMLDLSRLDAARDRGIVKRTDFDLLEILHLTLVNLTFLLESRELVVKTTLPDQPLVLNGDADQIAQLLTNLLTNAIQYNRPKGTIGVVAEQSGDQVHISISDTGIGIPADEITNIFERFYRGKDVRESTIPGNGLGLAIVEDIVALHDGNIAVRSVVGSGTVFDIWLPMNRSESNPAASPVSDTDPSTANPGVSA